MPRPRPPAGRQSTWTRANLWAAHGVAHVFEMQGRRAEGLAWIDALRCHWDGASNMRHHLWWHAAMFRLEYGETDAALALYDGEFRNPSSPLTAAQPDLYIDVQNAASMLFLLQRHGVDVGDRWTELADKAESRIGDCLSAFTLPHWMMALAATGRREAAGTAVGFLAGFRRRSAGSRPKCRSIRHPGLRGRAGVFCPSPRKRGRPDAPGARAACTGLAAVTRNRTC